MQGQGKVEILQNSFREVSPREMLDTYYGMHKDAVRNTKGKERMLYIF
jgi:hypothetical protein